MSRSVSIEKIKQGDKSAFESLFHAYYPRLCVYAENITKSEIASEEIVSNMFVKLWEKRGELNITTSVESYLVSSIHNQSLNYLKHAKVQEKYRKTAQYQLKNMDLLWPEDTPNPLATLITEEVIRDIEQAVDDLPAQCREIFRLNKFEDLSYDEIAGRLGISVNTVRTQIVRAMRKMKTNLGHYLPVIMGLVLVLYRLFWKKKK